jgi:hypothetical protein
MLQNLGRRAIGFTCMAALGACSKAGHPDTAKPATAAATASALALSAAPSSAGGAVSCLTSGDGYLRATVAGAIETHIDWPNSGTQCEGESRDAPPGIRLSFQRAGASPNLLLVFGLTGVRPGEPGRALGANVTVILQGTDQIYGTLGDARCTVDTLSQRLLHAPAGYRIEARGFCTQPAHAVRGKGDVLVSTFEFAGPVTFLPAGTTQAAKVAGGPT